MKRLSIFILFLLLPMFAFSQSAMISGRVLRAENGQVLIGASVSVKGTTRGTISDVAGKFKLSMKGDVILVAKYIGFKDLEIPIKLLNREKITQDFSLVSNDSQLQDVVVSANKSDEFLQRVSVAATVVSSRQIEQQSSYSTLEAIKDAPLLLTDAWVTSQTSFSIRGLSNNFDNVGFESTVGLYLDDVYYSRSYIFNSTLFDLERIEVLRGPQGTLFGKNTIGGVVHLISEKPEWANNGQIEIVAGNYNYYQIRGKWNQQLIKNKLSMRITGAATVRDGYVVDPNPAFQKESKTQFQGFRGSLFYVPNDKTDISFKAYYGNDEKAEQTMIYTSKPDFNPVGVAPTTVENSPMTIAPEFYRHQFGVSLKANYKLGKNTLTSVSAYNNSEDWVWQDFDETVLDISRWGRRESLKSLSQEFRITSPRDQKFAYIAGIYLQNEKIAGEDTSTLNKDFVPLAEQLNGENYSNVKNYFSSYAAHSQINSSDVATFGSGSYQLNDRFKLNLGLRFTNEVRQFSFYQNVNEMSVNGKLLDIMAIYALPVASAGSPIRLSTNDNVLTYDLGLDYKLNPFIMGYGKFVRGFKGSGFNTSVTKDEAGSSLVFKPEFVNSYEIGIKSKFSNRMRLNAALFFTDYKNKQEFLDEGTTVTIANAESTNGWGGEVEFSAMLKAFRIDVSAGFLDMRYRKFLFGVDDSGKPVDYSGNRLLKAPPYTLAISPSYTYRLKEKYNIMFGLNINSTGKSYNDISNSELLARQPTTLVNSRISLMPKNGKWSIALWGKNLTDARYIQHGWEYDWGNQISLGRPRTYGIELYLNFF